jgi:hypothetical protein
MKPSFYPLNTTQAVMNIANANNAGKIIQKRSVLVLYLNGTGSSSGDVIYLLL